MAEYIKRDAAIERLEKLFQLQAATARTIIDAIPAADVVEVRHAKFMPTKNFSGLKCSACGARVKNGAWRTHNWCYACGAKMDGGADDGKAD